MLLDSLRRTLHVPAAGLAHRWRARRQRNAALLRAGRRARKFQAMIMPLGKASDAGQLEAAPRWPASWRGVVRASGKPGRAGQLLTALITAQDGEPATAPWVTVTMLVIGPGNCFDVGDDFTLWQGTDVARGVVTRRLFV